MKKYHTCKLIGIVAMFINSGSRPIIMRETSYKDIQTKRFYIL